MHAFAAAGAGFLIAVLWFDLMFDVQARGQTGEAVAPAALASISAYYRRVTLEARPMNRLVTLAMLVTLGALIAEIVRGAKPSWIAWTSLAAAASAMGLARARIFRNAGRLARAAGPPEAQTALARTILSDHLFCLAAMTTALGLQLTGAIIAG